MKLSEFKKQRGMTDEQLAELIGDCTVSALRKWHAGERIPRKDQMERIVEVTDGAVTPNDFYDLSGAALAAAAPESAQ